MLQTRSINYNFKAGIFTNFTQDHLDYHLTMSDYFKKKCYFFKNFKNKKNIILKENS